MYSQNAAAYRSRLAADAFLINMHRSNYPWEVASPVLRLLPSLLYNYFIDLNEGS